MNPPRLVRRAVWSSFPRVSGDEPPMSDQITRADSFPRVSGDEPAFMSLDSVSMGFSPREWG